MNIDSDKLLEWIDSEIRRLSGFDQSDTGLISHNIKNELEHLRQAIQSGELDADRPECPKCGGIGASDCERIKTAIRNPWISLFMDGRNEHGTHLLPIPPDGICADEREMDDLLDSQCSDVERIFSEAEQAGYTEGCCIVAACATHTEDGSFELSKIDDGLTRLIHGGPGEQKAALERLAMCDCKASK